MLVGVERVATPLTRPMYRIGKRLIAVMIGVARARGWWAVR